MSNAGRHTKYTPDRVEKILTAIRTGAAYIHAAQYAGISFQTFNEWRKQYPEFSEAINEAEGAGAVMSLAKIQKAASDGNWTASAWLLERRHPEEYGRKDRSRVELSGPDGGAVQVQATTANLDKLTPDELRTMLAMLHKAKGDDAASGNQ